ncbi:HAD hydrolase family protein [bacterium]|nr:HAD hydrolase family protein [bacterium]
MNISQNIKMVISDFDGIFTDNTVIVNEDKSISRRVSFKDLMGVSILVKNGYKVGFISGEKNPVIEMIAEKFKLTEIFMGIRVKIDVLKAILERNNLTPDEVIYIGDDINDIACLEYVNTKITVPNANKKIKKIKNIQITKANGGDGAFREIVDEIVL